MVCDRDTVCHFYFSGESFVKSLHYSCDGEAAGLDVDERLFNHIPRRHNFLYVTNNTVSSQSETIDRMSL